MPKRGRWLPLLFLCVLPFAGCRAPENWFGPQGPMQTQQYEAVMHDPYTDEDAGPEVVGGRPRDFQKPLPEPVRNNWLQDSWWGR